MTSAEVLARMNCLPLVKNPPVCYYCGTEFGLGDLVAFATFTPEAESKWEPVDFLVCITCIDKLPQTLDALAFLTFLRGADV